MSDIKKPKVTVFHSHGTGQMVKVSRFPHPGETIYSTSWTFDEDGAKGSNVCVALGRLGVPTAFVGRTGDNFAADMGKKWMGDAGVDLRFMMRDERIKSGTGLVLTEESGANYIILGPPGPSYLKQEDAITALDELGESGNFFVTGFEIEPEIALFAARVAKDKGMKTILNLSPVPQNDLEAIPYIDIVVINEVEGRQLAGYCDDYDKGWTPEDVAGAVRRRSKAGAVLLTLGADGSLFCKEDEVWRTPPYHDVVSIDTAGSGDAFLAAFVANLVWGKTYREACVWANAYAGVSTTTTGTIPSYVTKAHMDSLFNSKK